MNIVVFGATSAIGHAVCRSYANAESAFSIVARNGEKLEIVKQDLIGRGASAVTEYVADATDGGKMNEVIAGVLEKVDRIDLLLVAHGVLPIQEEVAQQYEAFSKQFDVNFMSVAAIVMGFKQRMQEQGSGTIVVIGSVAGDRGRKSNYGYGTAKAALATYLQGLRNELFESGVSVLTVKPGFVDTPMTEGLKKGPLFASSEKVATDIKVAIEKRKEIVYTPWFWRFIMLLICAIPEKLFKRLSI